MYKFMLMLAPLSPIMGILALIGLYILVKNYGEKPNAPYTPNDDDSYSGDSPMWNPHATNNDLSDMVNGPNGPRY